MDPGCNDEEPIKDTATSLFPSADAAMETQDSFGALFDIHVAPEFVELYIKPLGATAAATSLVPSAEEATQFHCASGTRFDVQVIP